MSLALRMRDAVQTIELTLVCPRFVHRMLHPCVQHEQIMGSYFLMVVASFVIGRLCEGFACMLQLVTGVFVVMDFGVRGRRTDRGAKGLLGSTAVAWDVGLSVGQATLARPRSLLLACFELVDMARQDGKNIDTLAPARC